MTPLILGLSFAESCYFIGAPLFIGGLFLGAFVMGFYQSAAKPWPIVEDLERQDELTPEASARIRAKVMAEARRTRQESAP